MSEVKRIISDLKKEMPDPKIGLGDELFRFVSSCTPMVNVDLLIINKKKEFLLTWRHDEFYGPAWHIPGGIIRFRETISDRVKKVALTELGCEVNDDIKFIDFQQLFAKNRDIRGHFISFLFSCSIKQDPIENLKYQSMNEINNGQWKWHKKIPSNFLDNQKNFCEKINAFIQQ